LTTPATHRARHSDGGSPPPAGGGSPNDTGDRTGKHDPAKKREGVKKLKFYSRLLFCQPRTLHITGPDITTTAPDTTALRAPPCWAGRSAKNGGQMPAPPFFFCQGGFEKFFEKLYNIPIYGKDRLHNP